MLDSYMFKVKDIEKIDNTVQEVKNLSFTKDKINNINYGEDIVHKLVVVFNAIEKICLGAVIALILVTAFLIANTIKLAIYSRKIPFIIEGLFIGILGSIIPIVIVIFGYTTLFDFFDGELFTLATLVNPVPFIYMISLLLLGIGVTVGMLGSYQAVRKYLKI